MSRSIRMSAPPNRWTLQRFGLTPSKLRYRLWNAGAPRVLCVSIPKAGTHLLERGLCLHPRLYRKLVPTVSEDNLHRWGGLGGLLRRMRPGQIVASHLRFRPEHAQVLGRHDVRVIFLVRDPHDIVVSQVHYMSSRSDHRSHDLFMSLPDTRSRLRLAIAGDPAAHVTSIAERLDRFAGWLGPSLVVRFEDLIGPAGGGEASRQEATLREIFGYLGLEMGDAEIRSIGDRLFSSESPTFRRGAAGGWREAFDPQTEALFDSVVGDRAVAYGYHPAGGDRP